jgi:ATP-binding cassette subfamily B protein
VLLLDEITANLDADTEAGVIRALQASARGRTVISISHRLSQAVGKNRIIEIR